MEISFKNAVIVWFFMALGSVFFGQISFPNNTQLKVKKNSGVSSREVSAYAFSVEVVPTDARVRIMNIKQKYVEGMLLQRGRYDVEVSRPGYATQRQWISANKSNNQYTFTLSRE
ncbi:MAG: hypothetical protein ACJAS1_001849 [Oleiphilaceae bacterium]